MTPRTCTTCGAKLRANARAIVCRECSEATGAQWLAEVEALVAEDAEAGR